MKKIFIYTFLLSSILFSCKKSTDDVVPAPAAFQWPAGTSDYAPYTIGSTFSFEIISGTPAITDSFTYTVAKDTTINNLKFGKLVSNKPALASTYYSNYNNGVVTDITYNFNFQNQLTIPVVTQTSLKDNVAVNTTWNEPLVVTYSGINVNVNFVYMLMLKDFTKTILAKDYANTISVKQLINVSLPGGFPLPPNIPSSTQIDNYFAKGVGLVQKDAIGNNVKIKRFNIIK